MKTYHVHVYSIIAEMIVEVETDSERQALDDGRMMAEGRPASEWSKPSVSTVALIYTIAEERASD